MRDKKKGEDPKNADREALEREVDEMMDPARTGAPAVKSTGPAAKTAPQLSSELRQKTGAGAAEAKPIKIKKLDEITEKIAVSEEKKEKDEGPEQAEEQDLASEPAQADFEKGSTELDDARIDEAVDDIVAHEGDVMLAVEDATAAERNRQLAKDDDEDKGHPVLSTLFWTVVFFLAIVAVLIVALYVTGGNVSGIKVS